MGLKKKKKISYNAIQPYTVEFSFMLQCVQCICNTHCFMIIFMLKHSEPCFFSGVAAIRFSGNEIQSQGKCFLVFMHRLLLSYCGFLFHFT